MCRNICVALFFATVLVSAANAQIPTSGNVFVGYSYLSSDLNSELTTKDVSFGNRANLNGWNAALEGKVLPFVGVVADLSGHYGSENLPGPCGGLGSGCAGNQKAKTYNVIFGPRVSVPIGKFTPFAEALFGASHISGSASGFSNSNTSFADALGEALITASSTDSDSASKETSSKPGSSATPKTTFASPPAWCSISELKNLIRENTTLVIPSRS